VNLWRLEWLRLVRTRRIIALGATFAFFGITGPLLARYRDELFALAGGGESGVTLTAPPPVPADGIVNYVANASQIGLLVVAFVAAGALAVADRERALFLRTRVASARPLVLVPWAVTSAAAAGAFALGAALAWYGTAVALGSVPAGAMVAGTVLGSLYLAFLVALVALVAARTSGVAAPAAGGLGVALVLAMAGINRSVGQWLPSHLLGALADLATGGALGDYWRSAAVTIVAVGAALRAAVALAARREL
jgi:ABC-2 type transport system permease protein